MSHVDTPRHTIIHHVTHLSESSSSFYVAPLNAVPVRASVMSHTIDSCHAYEYALSQMHLPCHRWIHHVHNNTSRHTCEWVVIIILCCALKCLPYAWVSHVTYDWVMSHIWICPVTDAPTMSHINTPRHTKYITSYMWVCHHHHPMLRDWMSSPCVNESCHIQLSHVTHINKIGHVTDSPAISHINTSCHTCERVVIIILCCALERLPCVCMSHVT